MNPRSVPRKETEGTVPDSPQPSAIPVPSRSHLGIHRASSALPSRKSPRPPAPRAVRPEPERITDEQSVEPRKHSRTPSRGRPRTAETALLVETVFFFLYDIGRSVDLRKIAALVPAHDDLGIVKRRDTPASLSLPRPLILQLGESESLESKDFESFSAQAKIYDEGVVSLIVRVKLRIPFAEMRVIQDRVIVLGGRSMTIPSYADESFRRLCSAIRPAVVDPQSEANCGREAYTAFCLLECPSDPADFLEDNRAIAAALLIGEDPAAELHHGQIHTTLGKPFSYRKDDLAIFDLDRCLIIDPRGDYEDLLLIVEHANYQLLELRVLDMLLDKWLDESERDLRMTYSGADKGRKLLKTSPQIKLVRLQSLSFDALFILENLENSSKIIGDYYLGQIYDRLCTIFNTEGWKWSIERRLDTLRSVYDMIKTDASERKMLLLEVLFIIVCVLFPVMQILQVFLLG